MLAALERLLEAVLAVDALEAERHLLGGLGLWAEEKAIVLARCSTSAASVRMYVTQREPGRCTAGGKEQRAEIERRNEGKATTTGKCLRNFKVT